MAAAGCTDSTGGCRAAHASAMSVFTLAAGRVMCTAAAQRLQCAACTYNARCRALQAAPHAHHLGGGGLGAGGGGLHS